MKRFLMSNSPPDSFKDVIGFPFSYSEREFRESYDINSKQLALLIAELRAWIQQKGTSTQIISVLGI